MDEPMQARGKNVKTRERGYARILDVQMHTTLVNQETKTPHEKWYSEYIQEEQKGGSRGVHMHMDLHYDTSASAFRTFRAKLDGNSVFYGSELSMRTPSWFLFLRDPHDVKTAMTMTKAFHVDL